MIQMRVRQDNDFDGIGANRKRLPIALAQLFETLKQSAINKDAMIVNFEKVLGTGDGPRGAKASEGHVKSFRRCARRESYPLF